MNWKVIKDFESYEISDTGLIRRNKDQIIKPFDNKGYLRIRLYNNCKGKNFLVHRLVAIYFISNPENKDQVNHKDFNRTNNHIDNLEWVTSKENIKHAFDNKPELVETNRKRMTELGKSNGAINSLKSRKSINQYDLQNNLINTYMSARDAARDLGISYKCISKCCLGNLKTYRGFQFKFASVEGVSTI